MAVRLDSLPAAITLSMVAQTTTSMLAASVPVLTPEIAAGYGWNVNIVAFFPILLYAAAFIVSFYVPMLLVRFGGMGLSLLCIAASAIGLLCFEIPSLTLAAAAASAFGAANGAMNPASSQVLGPRITPRTAALVMAIKQTGVPLGATSAGIVAPLVASYFGWRLAIALMAVCSLAIAVILMPTIRWLDGPATTPGIRRYSPLEPLKRLLRIPGMLTFLLAGMAFAAMQLCLRSFFTVYLVKDLGFTLATAGFVFGISQAAGIGGQIGWALVADRVLSGSTVMVILGAVMAAGAATTAALEPTTSVTYIIAVAMVFGLSAGGFIPVVLGEIARRAKGADVGALTSSAQLFLISGAIIGPSLFGAVGSAFGYPAAFLTIAMWSVCVSALLGASHLRIGRLAKNHAS